MRSTEPYTCHCHDGGAHLGGRAGWRFTEADKLALLEAMRLVEAPARRRRRRAA